MTYKTVYEDEKTLRAAVTVFEAYGWNRMARKTRRLLRRVTKLANAMQSQF